MRSIDRKWGLILATLQQKHVPLKKEDIAPTQDELKIPLGTNDVANHALYVNLLRCKKGKAKGRVL